MTIAGMGIVGVPMRAITSAQDASDMNSQESRNANASSAMTTRFMPARNAGKNGHTRTGASSCRP